MVIYNGTQTGLNTIIGYYSVPIEMPYFLGVFRVPCYSGKAGQEKVALLQDVECEDYFKFSFTGVEETYEDLQNADIYFPNIGTWELLIYYQDNDINLDPDNADFLDTIELQIGYGES